jgi:hypothetical protein
MVRQSLKVLSRKLGWSRKHFWISAAVCVGLFAFAQPNEASAGWPHHGRNVGLWHTPISSVGQCYPRPVISHPAPYRCNPGFYIRRDACDYRWSFNYNRYCAPRGWCNNYRSFYDCRPACLPVFPSYYCPPTYYYGAYPVWYSNGIFLGVGGNQVFAQNQIQVAARNAAPPAAFNGMLQQALALNARANQAQRFNQAQQFNQAQPANTDLRNYYRDRAGEGSVVSIDTPRSMIPNNSLEDRLAQTRSIMSNTYNSSAGISNISRSSYTTDRSDLVAATSRLNQYRSDTSPQLSTPTPRSAVSRMVDGDIAFSKGYYHTAEIYYRQVGRDSIELKKDAAVRLACSQFARGDYLKAAQTFRWVNEQETVIDIGSSESDDSNPILSQWKSGLPKQQLAKLFTNRVVLEQHLNRLADRALQTENNGTELWLLGVLMGLDGDDNKSELFLTQASQTTGDFANTAKFLVDSGRDQASLQLAAQSHRSP